MPTNDPIVPPGSSRSNPYGIHQRQTYKETYKLHHVRLKADYAPTLPHLANGAAVVETYLLAAGKVTREDGTELEFQDLRVYLKVP